MRSRGSSTTARRSPRYDLEKVKSTASSCDTVIFLKDGRYFTKVIEMLKQSGFSDNSLVAIAQEVSVDGEIVKVSKLKDVINGEPAEKYFSILVVKRE